MNEFHPYFCTFCGEENEVFADASAFRFARRQQITEDCAVCCRPNLLTFTVENDGFVMLETAQEYDA